jgi:hypothetical protein
MRRLTLTGLAALGLLALLGPGRASAQYFQPTYRPGYGSYGRAGPALSPYLELTRGGNPAANYFLGVLPEMERRSTQAAFGTAIADLERRVEGPAAVPPGPEDVLGSLTGGGLPPTGHTAAFTNYSTYYSLTAPAAQAPRAAQSAQQARGR